MLQTWAFYFNLWLNMLPAWLLYVMFRFSTRIFYRGVKGFATDCPCGVERLLYVASCTLVLFWGNLVWNYCRFVSLMENSFFMFWFCFTYILIPHIKILLNFHSPYFRVSKVFYFYLVLWYSNFKQTYPWHFLLYAWSHHVRVTFGWETESVK